MTTHRAGRILITPLWVALFCCLGCGGERAETIVLAPGAVYPSQLTGEGPHRFRFTAEAGRFLHLGVDQRGMVDVVVSLRDPSGRVVYEVDGPTGKKGEEKVLVVTQTAGEYLLTVAPLETGAKGSFAVVVHAWRPAGKEDRLRAAAAASFTRAERLRQDGHFEEAASAYREAVQRAAALGDWRWLAEAEWRLGQALVGSGELHEGAAALESAASRFRGLSDGVSEARALNDLGGAWRKLGETQQALAAHQRALQLYRAAANLVGTATSLNNAGLALESLGDLEGAIQHYEESLALWRRLGERSAQAAPLENLGSLYSLVGHDQEALDLLTQALALLADEKDPGKRASILIALGWEEYLSGQPEKALRRYQEALTLTVRSGDRMVEAAIWDRRGSALRVLHRYAEARASYLQALDRSRRAGSRLNEGHTLANLGWLDLETGDAVQARERLQRAVELLVRSGDPNGEVYARVGLSRAEREMGAFGPAREQAETAVRLVEQIRAALRGPVSRGQFLATRFDAYEELVSLLIDLDRREPGKGYVREALEIAEKARARNLLEEITGDPGASGSGAQRQALLAEVHALEERRQALADHNPRDPHLPGLDAQVRQRWLDFDRLTALPNPQAGLSSLAAGEIQELADSRTLLIVYQLAEPASFAWTVDRAGVEVHRLPGRASIEKLARRVVAGLSASPEIAAQGSVSTALHELSQAVLTPLAPRLAGRPNLAILADGALHLVPFAALPEPHQGSEAPLVVQHEIAMIPSATVLRWQRRRLAGRPPAPGLLAALGDPIFSWQDERISKIQSNPSATASREVAFPGPLPRLPYTAEEARTLAGLVPQGSALLALGPAASRELVLSGALRRYRILHFATHGFLDPILPERSGIVLSQLDEKGNRRSGFLSAPQVALLDLPAELAVLSGCETGLGREVRGEGLVGLTQAFFRAGTRRVVVSLWKVRDRSTAQLMTRFYRFLLIDRLSPAAALRAAQLSLRTEDPWRSPHFWAGFSLQGDWK
jgi:CHAT domain-containing protein/tetratricopeptide (TPR) repeat protein